MKSNSFRSSTAAGPDPSIERRSHDRGATWTDQWLPTYSRITGVTFADDTTAVIVGARGVIFRSVDSGESWLAVDSPTSEVVARASRSVDPRRFDPVMFPLGSGRAGGQHAEPTARAPPAELAFCVAPLRMT